MPSCASEVVGGEPTALPNTMSVADGGQHRPHSNRHSKTTLKRAATLNKVVFVLHKEKIMKDTFVVYTSYREKFSRLSDEQMGILFPVSVSFDVVKCDMDANNAKYDAIVKRNQENGKRGGRPKTEPNPSEPKEPTGFFGNPSKPKKADNDSDNDSVSDSVNDNDTDSVNEKDTKKEEAIASKKEIVDALVAKWNSYGDRGRIPTIRSVSKDGKTWKSILARVQDNGIDTVVEVMDKVFASDYLRGFKTDWCAKFDWMMLPSNFEKIANGNYDNTSGVQKQSSVLSAWMERYGEA